MASIEKILEQVLRGTADANVEFNDLRRLLTRLGFEERTSGGHYIFRRAGIPMLINLQREGKKAKQQVRRMVSEFGLADEL